MNNEKQNMGLKL